MATYFLNCSSNIENFNLCIQHNVAGFPNNGYNKGDLAYLIVKENKRWKLGGRGVLLETTEEKPWQDSDTYKSAFKVNWELCDKPDITKGLRKIYSPNFGLAIQGKKDLETFQSKGEEVKSYLNGFFLDTYKVPPISNKKVIAESIMFTVKKVISDLTSSGLKIPDKLITRFVGSLLTKPFVILTGLSGSGKTKLAQAFSMWICEHENQYCIVPVGADWTNREPLLGFPNALESGKYVKPDNRVLDLIIDASANNNKPYFLILDEMNLSHVERYFADFLSVMESHKKISLHTGTENWGDVPSGINLPSNLFIVGTVNIDETTYMFSPKVLDRASVIEFRVTADEMKNYLDNKKPLSLKSLEAAGAEMANGFVAIANDKTIEPENGTELNNALISFFSELKRTGAEFGYRSASEILRFAGVINKIEGANWTLPQIIDAAIMQKLLPKLHGSRKKLSSVLITLSKLCIKNAIAEFKDKDEAFLETYFSTEKEITVDNATKIIYPLSFEKLVRMYHNLISNGFTSYAEA